jgi:hypothetical protein
MSSNSYAFDPTYYYRLFNNADPNSTLSSGAGRPGTVNMTAQRSLSSENWQLFHQSDCYFLRNYDYGPDWQLGLTKESRSVPVLLPRSGDLGQQWTLSQWSDGTWSFKSRLLGDNAVLNLSLGNIVPGMDTSESGSHWNIEINVSAGQITDSNMLSSVGNLQVRNYLQLKSHERQ